MTSTRLPAWLEPLAAAVADAPFADARLPGVPEGVPAGATPAAVLVLFADGAGGRELLLTKRADHLRSHAGLFSFPGGRIDPDDGDGRQGVINAALREAQEEVGLDPATVEIFGVAPTVWLPAGNYAVTPVLGYWHEPRELQPASADEVSAVVHQRLDELVRPANRASARHASGWIGPTFEVGFDVPVWGFTAVLLDHILASAGWEQAWDASDVQPLPELP